MPAKSKILALALIVTGLLGAGAAQADSMRCTSLYAACVAECRKPPQVAAMSTCITNCSLRRGACLRTGCWNDGRRTYCNMQRQ